MPMKLNFKVFKKGKPIYWVIGGVALFVLFYLMFNKGSSSANGSANYVSTGPSEALQASLANIAAGEHANELAANTQIAQTQGAVAIAGYQAQTDQLNIAASKDVADHTADNNLTLGLAQIDSNNTIAALNYSYGLETAKVASETALQSKAIDAGVLTHQMDTNAAVVNHQLDTNAAMFTASLDAATKQAIANSVSGSNVKESTRLPVLMNLE